MLFTKTQNYSIKFFFVVKLMQNVTEHSSQSKIVVPAHACSVTKHPKILGHFSFLQVSFGQPRQALPKPQTKTNLVFNF